MLFKWKGNLVSSHCVVALYYRLNYDSPLILPVFQTLTFTFVFRLEKLAEANRNRVILEAEAEAEALRVRGEAEAFAVEAKARAEAEQMAKKADAWKDYKEAAMVDMLLDTLPKVQFRSWVEKLILYIWWDGWKEGLG